MPICCNTYCTFEGKDQPIEAFHKCSSNKSGYRGRCKTCIRIDRQKVYERDKIRYAEKKKIWYENNKDRLRLRHQQWRIDNKEHIQTYRIENRDRDKKQERIYRQSHKKESAARVRKYYQRHRETIIQKHKEYRIKNRQDIRKRDAEYRNSNEEKVRQKNYTYRHEHPERARIDNAKRRALKKKAPFIEVIDRFAIYERDHGRCHICHRKTSRKTFTLDHLIPLGPIGPHTAQNLAVSHRQCNSSMGKGRKPAQLRLCGTF